MSAGQIPKPQMRQGIVAVAPRSINPAIWTQIKQLLVTNSEKYDNTVSINLIDHDVDTSQLLSVGFQAFKSSSWEAVIVIPHTTEAASFEASVIYGLSDHGKTPKSFRILSTEIPNFVSNILLENLEILDFANSVDAHEIFTGFPKVQYHESQAVSPDEVRAIADRWNVT